MAAAPVPVAVHSGRRLIGEALARCLSGRPDIVVVGHTCQWRQLATLCRLRQPTMVIIDVGDDLDATLPDVRQLLVRHPAMCLVVVTNRLDPAATAQTALAGVHLIVPYERGLAALVTTLEDHLSRGCGLTRRTRDARLTDRELEVLRLISAGLTGAQVALSLGIGTRSVENHMRRIFTKLGANSQALAVSQAAAMGLLEPGRPHADSNLELSPRESELLELAAEGASIRQMAAALGVAPKTVESELSGLYRKLGVHNKAAAVATAHALGLIS